MREHRHVGEVLARLAGALESLDFGPRSAGPAAERDRLVGVLRSYLIPRSLDTTTLMNVVVAGPTGSGKSTLVNSLAGLEVSRTGVLRPTTMSPVVVARADRAHRYESIGGVSCDVAPADAPILEHMVLVDAPDIDSTSTDHRVLAERLIDNADVVVFVTSALRYADDVPWQVLRRAVSRGTPVVHVLNRVGSASAGAIVDFKSRLAAEGLDDELITVPEHYLGGAAQVPSLAVRSLRSRLKSLVSDRDEFADEVFARVLRATISQVSELLEGISGVHDEIDGLEAEVGLDLATRVAALDLSAVTTGLYPEPPARGAPRALRRWRAMARREEHRAAEKEESVVQRFTEVIETDLRRWLVAEMENFSRHGVDHHRVIEGARAVGRSAAQGWIDYVARIAADHDESLLWLGEAVLLESAVSESPPPAADLLFGADTPVLVGRAKRELVGRLEVVYEQVGAHLADDLRAMHGDIDDSELRASLGAATVTLAPIYA